MFFRSSALRKSFLNRRYTFLTRLKNNYSNFKAFDFFFHTHKYTTSTFSLQIFSIASNPHSQDLFLVLRNTRFRNWLNILTVSSIYIRIKRISYSKKDLSHSSQYKALILSAPHKNYLHCLYNRKIQITPKNLFCFE